MRYYKMVLMPIEVPVGHFCWGDGRICGQFTNEGGHPDCGRGFYDLKYDKKGRVPKPKGCLFLKEVEKEV